MGRAKKGAQRYVKYGCLICGQRIGKGIEPHVKNASARRCALESSSQCITGFPISNVPATVRRASVKSLLGSTAKPTSFNWRATLPSSPPTRCSRHKSSQCFLILRRFRPRRRHA